MSRYGDVLEVSNSEAQAYSDCLRRWWLSYYRGLRPKAEGPVGPLSIGNRIHRSLEEGYSTPGREGAARLVLAESLERDWPLAEGMGPDVLKQFESEAELCLIMLEGFFEWAAEEGLDDGWEIVAHERIVRAPPISVLGQDVVLKGKLDQLRRRLMDGALFMRDWKTTATMNPVMLQFGPQLKTYILLLQLTEPDAVVSGGEFVFIKKVKRTARANPPFYSVEPVYVSERQMDAFWRSTTGTLRRMVETTLRLDDGGDPLELAPPRPTRDCSWRCPFYKCCDMFDDGSDVERYLQDNYEAADPYEYYGDAANKGDAE